MQLPLLLAAATAITSSLAAPAGKSMMAADTPQWTIESFKRTCDSSDTSCDYSYSINTHTADAVPCSYTVTGSPASQASYNNIQCGAFTVSSNWSGQFGPGNGFQTLAIVNEQSRLIAYPAYRDSQLVNGQIVSPDQSYTPQNLP